MSRILIIDGGMKFGHSGGELNHTLTNVAATFLREQSHQVTISLPEQGYDPEEEVQKYLDNEFIIYQMPGWWMGEPWIIKKYIDEVFTTGHGKLYASDGRSRSDASKKYGSGGLIQGKKYMLSVTWNAPLEAFTDPVQFFEGVGVEGVYLHFHKANQFLGMQPLPGFICNDVIKQPDIENNIIQYREHLRQFFA